MGPPPFGDGNIRFVCTFTTGRPHASMGPPPFGDGNSITLARQITGRMQLQWGHRLSAMETPAGQNASPLKMLQWGHRLSAMETLLEDDGTNSRLNVLQWGHRLSAMETSTFLKWLLSIYRLQWGHRLSAMETWYVYGRMTGSRSPNGATAFRRWKPAVTAWSCAPSTSFNGATAFRRWKLSILDLCKSF